MDRQKIAFIPGAFRPFGDHHMKMVKNYADTCDKVIIVISNQASEESKRPNSYGIEIGQDIAKQIIDLCLADSSLSNVTTIASQESNPIRTVLRQVSQLKDCDVVLGVSTKDSDAERFDDIQLDYFKDSNVAILPPRETAYVVQADDCGFNSASDIRNHLDDRDMLRTYLPTVLEDETFQKIYDILNGIPKNTVDSHDELRYDSQIFQNLLSESLDAEADNDDLFEENVQLDEEQTKYSDLTLTDEKLDTANCHIIAYNTHIMEGDGDEGVYNPKNNPDKAVDVVFEFEDGNRVEIFLDPETKEWDSLVNSDGKLTPDQMGQYFSTGFSHKVDDRLRQMWPESDPYFAELLDAVQNKKVNCEPLGMMTEDGEFRKGNIDKEKSREKNAAGKQVYTNSGRKIVSFSDFGVKHTEDEAYFAWPEKNKEFKWSQWADWNKIRPVLRMRFKHLSYTYGLSLSPIAVDDKNRGFRSYNLDLEPKLQYCTPIETQQMMDLTIVQKFLRNAYKRLNRFVSIPDEELFQKINAPDRCTLDDIRKTKHVIRNTMKAVKDRRADTYIYT